MSTLLLHYRPVILPWNSSEEEEQHFRRILKRVLLLCLVLSMIMPWLPLPKPNAIQIEELPPRYAKLLLEQQPPPPPPVAAKPVELLAIMPSKPKSTAADKPLDAKVDAARHKAASVGLLALSKELSALANASSIDSSLASRKINTAPTNIAAATVDMRILTAATGRKSVAVSQGSHAGTVGTTKLDDNRQKIAQGLLEASTPGRGANGRGDEDIALIMDQYKGALYAIYNRARRANPELKGKIILVLTIQPTGQVSNVAIKSSELNAPELEASLVARVRQFDFGERQGGPLTVTVPVEFLPS